MTKKINHPAALVFMRRPNQTILSSINEEYIQELVLNLKVLSFTGTTGNGYTHGLGRVEIKPMGTGWVR